MNKGKENYETFILVKYSLHGACFLTIIILLKGESLSLDSLLIEVAKI